MKKFLTNENSLPSFDSVQLLLLEGATKSVCHRCLQAFETKYLVQCQISGCGTYYCRPCLVRRYKYSKKAANKLPSSIWKCPKCRDKCICIGYSIALLISCASIDERQALLSRIKHNRGIGFKREVEELKEHENQICSKNNKLSPTPALNEDLIDIKGQKWINSKLLIQDIYTSPLIVYNHFLYNPNTPIIDTQMKDENKGLCREGVNNFNYYYNEEPAFYKIIWKGVKEQVLGIREMDYWRYSRFNTDCNREQA